MTPDKIEHTQLAKLIDGPLAGEFVRIPRGAEVYKVGSFFTYTYAGKEQKMPLLAKRPASRAARRALLFLIGQTGADPRVERSLTQQRPKRGRTTVKHRRGAIRRGTASQP